MTCVFFVPVAVIWGLFAKPIIEFATTYGSNDGSGLNANANAHVNAYANGWNTNENEQMVSLAQTYLRTILLGVPGYIIFECGKRFLQAQGIFHASTLVLAICAPLNIMLNYTLVWNSHIGLGFIGAPLAVATTNWIMAAMISYYIAFVDGYQCWTPISFSGSGSGMDSGSGSESSTSSSLFNFREWSEMVSLALPGVIMVEAEFLAYEVMTILCARFGTEALAAQSVTATCMSLFYQIPFSVSFAASTRIANYIGGSDTQSATKATRTAMGLVFLIAVVDGSLIYAVRNHLGALFSRDSDVVVKVGQIGGVLALCHFLDAPCAVFAGILRGIGRQRFGGYMNLFGYYGVALPLAVYFAFGLNLQLKGLWMGIACALVLIAGSEVWYILNCSYEQVVAECKQRQSGCDNVQGSV